MFVKTAVNQFLKALDKIKYGTLTLTSPDGHTRHFQGSEDGPSAHMFVHDWKFIPLVIRKGSVGFAEAYRDKVVDTDNLPELLDLILQNAHISDTYAYSNFFNRIAYAIRLFLKPNNRQNSADNIHSHYDIGNNFYELWLDKSMTYSSALFKSQNDQSLESAQNQKYQRILDSIGTSGSLLEIGCGWGGFADVATQKNDYQFKGITVSQNQLEYASHRLKSRASIEFEDYRDQKGLYDTIVSIEMFEAVGEKFWPTYFQKIKNSLKPQGTAVIQTIFSTDANFENYKRSNDFIRQFIFPGGLVPSPSRFKEEIAKAELKIVDSFFFAESYARTLYAWLKNFDNALPSVRALGFDEPFIRIWRLYLASCAVQFAANANDVGQIQIQHA
jgi:cyclopropane-fatty-acyl-phospholipid synthase